MPAFDLRDLKGKRVTSASLKGKPTLVNFYFAKCKPCILEVGPLNEFAAARPHMNFLAVTFDDTDETRAFVDKYKFKWRVVPNARDLIDRVRVKSYPMMALFDADGPPARHEARWRARRARGGQRRPAARALDGRFVAQRKKIAGASTPGRIRTLGAHDCDAKRPRRGHRRQPLRARRPAGRACVHCRRSRRAGCSNSSRARRPRSRARGSSHRVKPWRACIELRNEAREERREKARRTDDAKDGQDVRPARHSSSAAIYRPVYIEESYARLAHAVSTDRPFLERLTQFWTNHFAVSIDKPRSAASSSRSVIPRSAHGFDLVRNCRLTSSNT